MKQVIEIHHHGELILRFQVDGSLGCTEVFGHGVSVIGRPELVDKLPRGLRISQRESDESCAYCGHSEDGHDQWFEETYRHRNDVFVKQCEGCDCRRTHPA